MIENSGEPQNRETDAKMAKDAHFVSNLTIRDGIERLERLALSAAWRTSQERRLKIADTFGHVGEVARRIHLAD